MRLFQIGLFLALFSGIFLFSCQDNAPQQSEGEATVAADSSQEGSSASPSPLSPEEQLAKMEPAAQAEMAKLNETACACLQEHAEAITNFTDKALPAIAEAKEKGGVSLMEVLGPLMPDMRKMKGYRECGSQADSSINQNLIDEAMAKILGENMDPKAASESKIAIMNAQLKQNCPDGFAIQEKITAFAEAGQSLQGDQPAAPHK
ncbi:hypothetical protein [Saprospira grandis]|uniref:Lipoprotein n=1 Tax=Saprospira grandis (strain Lewin) TaxID=984262 RepID=H6L4J3_SAPGL|nr:hypothetical protein [Saprospira grandis]AFC23917.1 hypothetical protein SGRA_1182 [Saprospira grandis str. Lewin]